MSHSRRKRFGTGRSAGSTEIDSFLESNGGEGGPVDDLEGSMPHGDELEDGNALSLLESSGDGHGTKAGGRSMLPALFTPRHASSPPLEDAGPIEASILSPSLSTAHMIAAKHRPFGGLRRVNSGSAPNRYGSRHSSNSLSGNHVDYAPDDDVVIYREGEEREGPESPARGRRLSALPPVEAVEVPSEIKCPICLDAFSSPVTLSCNHNICHIHILDLACQEPDYINPQHKFIVKCPKCRTATTFAEGEASVHINTEMKALVEMMMKLLSKAPIMRSGTPPSGGELPGLGPNESPANEAPVAASPILRTKSNQGLRPSSHGQGTPGRKVRFSGIGDTIKEGREQDEAASAGHDPQHQARVQKAQKALASLEQQLEEKRQKMKEEREAVARDKVLAYKRARAAEIARRRERMMLELQAEEVAGNIARLDAQRGEAMQPPIAIDGLTEQDFAAMALAVQRAKLAGEGELPAGEVEELLQAAINTARQGSVSSENAQASAKPNTGEGAEKSTIGTEGVWRAAEKQFEALRKRREEKLEAERAAREDAVRDQVTSWANRVKVLNTKEDGVLEKQLRELERYEAGHLSESVKARLAEEQFDHLYKPKTDEELALEWAREKQAREEEERERRRQKVEAIDEEVERAMWTVEQRVLQEHEAELTRAQMADIAEQRARAMIAEFSGKAKGNGSNRTPSYTPKLKRMQRF